MESRIWLLDAVGPCGLPWAAEEPKPVGSVGFIDIGGEFNGGILAGTLGTRWTRLVPAGWRASLKKIPWLTSAMSRGGKSENSTHGRRARLVPAASGSRLKEIPYASATLGLPSAMHRHAVWVTLLLLARLFAFAEPPAVYRLRLPRREACGFFVQSIARLLNNSPRLQQAGINLSQ